MARRSVQRVAVGLVVALAGLVVLALPASAHPLGNFTTNRLARVEVGADVIRVAYVLDEAELVAFRERDAVAADPAAFATRRTAELLAGLSLTVDGAPVALRAVAYDLAQPAGQGGLTTLRLDIVFEGRLPAGGTGARRQARFADANAPDRLGWREIVVVPAAGSGTVVRASSVPRADRTDGLRSYPSDPGTAPSDVRSATFTFVAGRGADRAARVLDEPGRSRTATDRFAGIVARTTSTPLAILGALLVALLFGAVHALGPGHGKTIMAAYLVSTRGRRRDAVALGAVVSLMHTVSVLALAAVLALLGRDVAADRLYPTLSVLAGLLVVGVGINLLLRRRRILVEARSTAAADVAHSAPARVLVGAGAPVHDHDHDHQHHDHQHHDHQHHDHQHHDHQHHDHQHHDHQHHDDDHGRADGAHVHGDGRAHSHALPEGVAPLSRAGLLALGASGGLFPSPSAVVVLVGAFTLGRAALGLALITAFSIGLAAVLVGVGLLLVAGRDRLLRSGLAVHLPWLPILGAAAITALGVVLTVQGFAQLS